MKSINPLQCSQCGSHDIRQEVGGSVCNYCGTIHYGHGPKKFAVVVNAFLRRNKTITIVTVSTIVLVIAVSTAYFAGGQGTHTGGTESVRSETSGGIMEEGGDSIEPEKKVSAEFRDIAALPDGIGNIYFVGMFTNTGETPIYPRAEIVLCDKKGMKVAVARGYGIRGYILPGEKTPIQVLVTSAPSFSSVRSIGVPEIPSYYQERPKLSISGLNMKRPESGMERYRVNGDVKNNSGKNVRYVQIAVAAFDGSGNIIGYSSNYLGQTVLLAREESPFTVEMHLMKGKPARYMVEYDALPDKGSE